VEDGLAEAFTEVGKCIFRVLVLLQAQMYDALRNVAGRDVVQRAEGDVQRVSFGNHGPHISRPFDGVDGIDGGQLVVVIFYSS
jgi:hypothetical protein